MAYNIIRGRSDTEVEVKVETAQKEGWQCQGGIALSAVLCDNTWNLQYAQAMVREDYDFPEFIEAPQEPRPVYKVGDRVRVIANTTHHNFDIGAEVIVEGVYEHPKPYITATYRDRHRNLYFDDIEPLSPAPYQVGDIVRIARNTTAHEFEIGEMVEVITVYDDRPKPFVVATDDNKQWNVHFDDITLVRRRPAMSKAP